MRRLNEMSTNWLSQSTNRSRLDLELYEIANNTTRGLWLVIKHNDTDNDGIDDDNDNDDDRDEDGGCGCERRKSTKLSLFNTFVWAMARKLARPDSLLMTGLYIPISTAILPFECIYSLSLFSFKPCQQRIHYLPWWS